MSEGPIRQVAICGGGLAAWLAALSLRSALPGSVAVTVVETEARPADDDLYGQILPPEGYPFHLEIGVGEPELMAGTNSTFAYGTEMRDWAGSRSWVQVFHQPLAVWEGSPLATLVGMRDDIRLQDLLIAAQAVRRGVFAHPPEDAAHPLSRAEYGYAVAPDELGAFYERRARASGVRKVSGTLEQITRNGDSVQAIRLASGESIQADLFIDASGARQQLAATPAAVERELFETIANDASTPIGPPARVVVVTDDGWQSQVTLRSGARRMQVATEAGPGSVPAAIGRTDTPWSANVVAIGRAACRMEPLTVAPMRLLLRDITRLMSLFPVSTQTSVEAREYNRAFADDTDHAELFQAAHFALPESPDTPYWRAASKPRDGRVAEKLARKLDQYEARGLLVSYDHEPFDDVDWAVLHDGLGRRPRRRDLLAELVGDATVMERAGELREAAERTTARMPPHPVYLEKFLSYLRRKHG